jgi:hypothetical protein
VPILSRGLLRAVLLLENRLIRAAFTTGRLDAVNLIASQLTVSLDNAQLYAEVAASRARILTAADETRRRIERDLHDGVQQRLVTHWERPSARWPAARRCGCGCSCGSAAGSPAPARSPPTMSPPRLGPDRPRVEAVGGRMTLDSPAGVGTVLTVLLPLTADEP